MIKKFTDVLLKFRNEREWKKFHTPLRLAISLQLEASEVLECFQWKSEKESTKELRGTDKKIAIKEELADVLAYLLLLADSLGIDLVRAFEEKMEKNSQKYPVAKSRGNARKYTELQ